MKCWVFLKSIKAMEDELNYLLKNNGGFRSNVRKDGRTVDLKIVIDFSADITSGFFSKEQKVVEYRNRNLINNN